MYFKLFLCTKSKVNSEIKYDLLLQWSILFSNCHNLPASGTREALLMVRIAKCRHHFSLNIVTTVGTFGTKLALIVCRTVIVAILTEEATLSQ
jgi:hypothetical protein